MKEETKIFLKCAAKRSIRTVAQSAIAVIGTTAVIEQVDWKLVISSAALAGILSILNSIVTGLPESETMS
jgi:hypothetical protein